MSIKTDIELLHKKSLFDPQTQEPRQKQRIIGGRPDGIFAKGMMSYPWANSMYELMRANTWQTSEPNLTNEAKSYKSMPEEYRRAFKLFFAGIIFNDSAQFNNIMDNFNPYITAPDVNKCLIEQAAQEALHAESYGVTADAAISTEEREELYNLWRTDDVLREKNYHIAKSFETLGNDPTKENIYLATIANGCLENIYFQSAFIFFAALSRAGYMHGSLEMIKLIFRDESTHVTLFQNINRAIRRENPEIMTPELYEKAYKIIDDAVKLELKWANYVFGDYLLGFTPILNEQYTNFLGNRVLKGFKLDKIYPDNDNPYQFLEDMLAMNNSTNGGFDGRSTDYSIGLKMDF